MTVKDWVDIGLFVIFVASFVVLWLIARGYLRGKYAQVLQILAQIAYDATEEYFRREPLPADLKGEDKAKAKRHRFQQNLKLLAGKRIKLRKEDLVAAQAIADGLHYRHKVWLKKHGEAKDHTEKKR